MEVTIRPLIKEDAYTSVKWRNDPEVFKYTGNTYDHEITLESELNWIKKVIANKNEYRCAILADGTYVGNIYLTDITDKDATYHIFIGNKDYWGKGVAKQASNLILEYAFNTLGLQSVNLRVHIDNVSAIALYKILGFQTVDFVDPFYSMTVSKNQDITNVTIMEAKGDGACFDFIFNIKDPNSGNDTIEYRLYPHYDNKPYPQRELIYKNYKYGLASPSDEEIEFWAPMPEGYRVAYEITQDNAWPKVRGVLTICSPKQQ